MDGCPGCELPNSRGTIRLQCTVTRTLCNLAPCWVERPALSWTDTASEPTHNTL